MSHKLYRRVLAFILCAVVVFAAHRAASQEQRSKAAPKVPAGFDIPAAMQSLFGNYDPKTDFSRYDIPQSTVYNLKGSGFEIGDDILVSPLWASAAIEDGKRKVVLVTYAVPAKEDGSPKNFDCHACTPLIGASIFVKDGKQWKVESSRGVITRGGGFGDPPSDFRVIHVGPHRIGIEITDGDEGQGETTKLKRILVPWNGKVNEALRAIISNDNKGGCGYDSDSLACYSNWKSMTFTRGTNPDYFDVMLKLSGTELTEDPYHAKPVHGCARLSFVDGAYKTVKRTGDRTHLEQEIETIQ